MLWRVVTSLLMIMSVAVLGRRIKLPSGIGREIRRRLNLAFYVFLIGYLVLAAIRVVTSPPGQDQLAILAGVAGALALLWLALRLVMALIHSR